MKTETNNGVEKGAAAEPHKQLFNTVQHPDKYCQQAAVTSCHGCEVGVNMAGAQKVVKSGLSSALAFFFEYDTPKIVHISSKTVGVINRLIQLVIVAYLIGYELSNICHSVTVSVTHKSHMIHF